MRPFFCIWDSLLTYTVAVSLHCWLTSEDDHISMRIESMLLTIHLGKPKNLIKWTFPDNTNNKYQPKLPSYNFLK